MIQLATLLISVICIMGCAQDKRHIKGETEFQRELNAEYKDASKSPLTDRDRKKFDGLDFFKVDSTYVVQARLELTPDSEWFNMQTTTSRVSKERIFGILHFELKGSPYQLKVYQGAETMQQEGMEDYLFLPFLDETNGLGSYGGGRYMDLRIPQGDTMEIDFNTAYNPFCAYNEKYSCPIVPRENYLKTKIEAGVKDFVKR